MLQPTGRVFRNPRTGEPWTLVRAGRAAQVRLTAYQLHTTPTLTGQLVYPSADAQTEPATDIADYLARIRLDRAQLARLDGIALYPGMPPR